MQINCFIDLNVQHLMLIKHGNPLYSISSVFAVNVRIAEHVMSGHFLLICKASGSIAILFLYTSGFENQVTKYLCGQKLEISNRNMIRIWNAALKFDRTSRSQGVCSGFN